MDAAEIYVLCGARTSAVAHRFLDTFAERRMPAAEDFPFPEFSDEPEDILLNTNELIDLLESRSHEPYAIYWDLEGRPAGEQVMLFFTEDGGMIAGIGGHVESVADALITMSAVVNGKYGYVTNGTCPPATIEEFKAICEQSTLTNLFEGKLRASYYGDQ